MASSYSSSKPPTKSSWPNRLQTILRPPPRPASGRFGYSCSQYRHTPGDIWRHTLAVSVYDDLAGSALQHSLRDPVIWRRFVRIENLGLSGVVFYEIPIPSSSSSSGAQPIQRTESVKTARGALAFRIRQDPPVVTPPRITLASVFGDMDNDADGGMDLDDLMDEIDAKVVYFPAYACTSFIVGQVMSAFLNDSPSRKPVPAREGFSVCLGESVPEALALNESLVSEDPPSMHSPTEPSTEQIVSDVPRSPEHSIPDTLVLETDDPYAALCIRSSTARAMETQRRFLRLFGDLDQRDHMNLQPLTDSEHANSEADEASHMNPSCLSLCSDSDLQSNLATDGQASLVLRSASAPHVNAVGHQSLLRAPTVENGHLPRQPEASASTTLACGAHAPAQTTSDPLEHREKGMQSFVALRSMPATAVRRHTARKSHLLRSSHFASLIPCLAARIHPPSLYMYKNDVSSGSFMDLSASD